MTRLAHNMKCKFGHLLCPVSYRENKTSTTVRILNYWYCVTCNELLKIKNPLFKQVNAK